MNRNDAIATLYEAEHILNRMDVSASVDAGFAWTWLAEKLSPESLAIEAAAMRHRARRTATLAPVRTRARVFIVAVLESVVAEETKGAV